MLVIMFLFLTDFLISSGTCSTPKLLKQTISFLLQNKAIQFIPRFAYSSRFITYAPSFIFLDRLIFEKRSLNLGLLWYYFCISKFVKGWSDIKNPNLFQCQFLQFIFLFLLPEPAITIVVPAKRFPNKLAPKVHNCMLENLPFCTFVSFLSVLVTPFNKIWTIERFSLCHSFLCLQLLKLFSLTMYFLLNSCINHWSSCCNS